MAPGHRWHRRTLLLLALFGLVLGGVQVPLAPAASADQVCWYDAVKRPDGSIVYVKRCADRRPGDPGNPGDGGGPDLSCFGNANRYQPGWFCVGKAPCYLDDPMPGYPDLPTPGPGESVKIRWCYPCGECLGPPAPTPIVTGDAARPLIVQAQEAFGNLAPPAATVRHSPETRAVVRLDTWFWIDPAAFAAERGSSAEGLVAVAEPDRTRWDPGDGSAPVGCDGPGRPWSPGATGPACTHTYLRSSARYDGQVTPRWAVHYENGGAPVDIPGAPAELLEVTPFQLTVVEVQVLNPGPR
jgi:hypothetical protein